MIERVLLSAGSALLLSAIYALVASRFGPVLHAWLRARHARRLDARLARGSDRYFEELRELQTNTPRAYVAHGFAWHFIRIFALMTAAIVLMRLIDFLFSFSPE